MYRKAKTHTCMCTTISIIIIIHNAQYSVMFKVQRSYLSFIAESLRSSAQRALEVAIHWIHMNPLSRNSIPVYVTCNVQYIQDQGNNYDKIYNYSYGTYV